MKKEMKPEDIRWAGVALMLGGVTMALAITGVFISNPINHLWFPSITMLVFFTTPLLAVGLLGLRARYGDRAGGLGKNSLLIGAILGPISSITGFFGGDSDLFWLLMGAGPAILLAGLTMFGLAAMHRKPLPRWNTLPVFAGFWYPAMLAIYIIISMVKGNSGNRMDGLWILLIVSQGAALVLLGNLVRTDTPDQTRAIA